MARDHSSTSLNQPLGWVSHRWRKRLGARGQGGFTLIELLVVVGILGLLAGVIVFAVGRSTANAQVAECQTESAAITTAANSAKVANKLSSEIPGYVKENYSAYLTDSNFFTYFSVTGDLSVGTNVVATPLPGVPAGCVTPPVVTP